MEQDPHQARDAIRDSHSSAVHWNFVHRICFRFLFSYLALYMFLHWFISQADSLADLELAPGAGMIAKLYAKSWAPLVIWIGKHILHVHKKLSYFSGGNSDGIYSFVEIFCFAVIALLAACVWTFLDRKKIDYRQHYDVLKICLRYALAFTLLSYGMNKVVPTQFFGLPNLIGLVSPYGDFSRFSLLWNFMGYSATYTIFTGLVEVSAGLLLLFRRTTTLGALAAAAALVNVAVLDFSYGVPEKLDVLHLILMSTIILAPDFGRLANFFVFNRPAAPAAVRRSDARSRTRIMGIAAKLAVVAFMIVTTCFIPFKIRKFQGPHSPIYGIYEVQEFSVDGQLSSPLTTDAIRWKKIVFQSEDETYLEKMDDSWHFYETQFNKPKKEFTLAAEGDKSNFKNVVTYFQPDPEHLILTGAIKTGSILVKLIRVDEMKLPLMKSKFRWINGEP